MADYYPLVAKAIAGLEKNTGEGRRALYDRARTALVGQLRSMSDPALTEAEITRERLSLEEAIRKVEAESARRPREPAKPSEASKTASGPELDENGMSAADRLRSPTRTRTPPGERRSVTDEGLKGFHDIMAEAEGLGEAPAQAARSAREVFAATPPAGRSFDRVEPRAEPEGLRTPVRPPRTPEPPSRTARAQPQSSDPFAGQQPAEPRPGMQRQGPLRQPAADDIDELPRRSRVGLVAAILTVLIILALGVAAFWQRDRVAALFNAVRAPTQQTQKDAPTTKKFEERVGEPKQPTQPNQAQPTPTPANPAAPVVQRVVLYEEDPNDPQGKRYVGSAIWRTETASPAPNAAPDLAVRADLEIPERRITMTFSLRRNSDQAMPASHTIEVMFNLPADFPFGGISNVPGILMKQAEQTRGAPLAGLAVKVTSGYFLVGLSAVESDMQRNLQLLKERPWFDIPIVYNNGRRAILAIEKGTPGERAFEEAFKAWGQ
ncbi:MAG: hypothetical protein QOG38_2923 [Hyphomicrobiales bacterium]|jgi:hypothetical protein|nr:hypothetical protein [Hyphomicrobiales bacterium]